MVLSLCFKNVSFLKLQDFKDLLVKDIYCLRAEDKSRKFLRCFFNILLLSDQKRRGRKEDPVKVKLLCNVGNIIFTDFP